MHAISLSEDNMIIIDSVIYVMADEHGMYSVTSYLCGNIVLAWRNDGAYSPLTRQCFVC